MSSKPCLRDVIRLWNSHFRLRQCVDHPLLVLGKSGEDGELGEKILESGAGNGEGNLRDMIAMYAGGIRAETPEDVDKAYAAKVLKELGEQEDTPICELCSNEMFDEVLLPCYHRRYVFFFCSIRCCGLTDDKAARIV